MNIDKIDGTYSIKLWMSLYDSDFLEKAGELKSYKTAVRMENEARAKAKPIFGNKPCSRISIKDF